MPLDIVVKENNNNDSLKKLISLQKELFFEGYTLKEYERYIQENIENDYFHYRKLNNDDINNLCKRYNNLLNKIQKDHTMSRRQRKLYREKRKNLCYEKRRELISRLIQEINKTTGRDLSILLSDPDQWEFTKKHLFTGGPIVESDKKWCKIYKKLTSPNQAHLFNLNSNDDFVNYIYNNHNH